MLNRRRLLDTFYQLLRINSPSGEESTIAAHVAKLLTGLGASVRSDATGNVLAFFSGDGEPVLLSAHLDTVASTAGLVIVERDGVISSDGSTIVGADDKAGLAALLEAMSTTVENKLPHPPVEMVLTVGEEVGLLGAKALDFGSLRSRRGICLDSNGPAGTIIVQGPAQVLLNAAVQGKAAHAGVAPELGISAIVVAAEAISKMKLGRVDEETTANVGIISGGTATNVIPERVDLRAEARSRDEAKLRAQFQSMIQALEEAASRHGARAAVDVEYAYRAFKLSPREDLVRLVVDSCHDLGVMPELRATGGGSDANIYNEHGIVTVNLGVGYLDPHSIGERIAVGDLVGATGLLVQILSRA